MTSSIFTFLFSLFSLFTLLQTKQFSANKKCSKSLAGIVYTPETCAYQYLNKLSKQFLSRSELIFADANLANSYIYSFTVNYNMEVDLVTPIGTYTRYFSNLTNSAGTSDIQFAHIAHSYLNVPGFNKGTENYYFSFLVFSDDSEMYTVTFVLPLGLAPSAC